MLFSNLNNLKYRQGSTTLLKQSKMAEDKTKSSPDEARGNDSIQGGKTICATFCASLIAGSRRAFLCVDRVRLFVCFSQREFWLRLNEMHKVWTFSSRKAFFLCVAFVFRHLKITLDSDQPMLKEKRIIPSVWGGIKSFEHFQRGEYFSDCSFDLFVTWFRLLSPGWIRTRFFFFISKYFFTCPGSFPWQTSFILLFSERTILCAVKRSWK